MKRWKLAVVVLVVVLAVVLLGPPLYYMASNIWTQIS